MISNGDGKGHGRGHLWYQDVPLLGRKTHQVSAKACCKYANNRIEAATFQVEGAINISGGAVVISGKLKIDAVGGGAPLAPWNRLCPDISFAG